MNKQEFLAQLRKALAGLPQEDINERIAFYDEMIDDRMEEGFPEAEAVRAIGPVDAVVTQILSDIPLTRLVKGKTRAKREQSVWGRILLILGSPIWFSLLAAAFAVVFSLYIALWAVVISLWAAFVSFSACAVACIPVSVFLICNGNVPTGIALIAAAFVCAGFAVLLFFGCKAATKGSALLAKKFVLAIKNCFIRKEAA